LAGQVILQIDQAAFAHKEVFGNQRERGQDAKKLVHRGHLRADCHCQQGVVLEGLALHFSADFICVCFRKKLISCALQTDAYTIALQDCAKQLNLFTFLTGDYCK
jgi:hypothetical protein